MGEHALGLELGDEAKRLTFEDLETGFRRSYQNSGRRSLRRAGSAWDHLREHFGSWKARAITANALESYASERLKEAAPATVQYELAVVRRAMTLAVKKGQLRSRPHFPHVGVHNARTGFFTREEMEKIAAEIGPELGNLVRVAFWTGWRRGELLTLKWADVDWEAGVLRLRPTSTIAPRRRTMKGVSSRSAGSCRSKRRSARSEPTPTTWPAAPAPSRSTSSIGRASRSATSGGPGQAPVSGPE
jgi:integrase